LFRGWYSYNDICIDNEYDNDIDYSRSYVFKELNSADRQKIDFQGTFGPYFKNDGQKHKLHWKNINETYQYQLIYKFFKKSLFFNQQESISLIFFTVLLLCFSFNLKF
jgi:hypothetical protein